MSSLPPPRPRRWKQWSFLSHFSLPKQERVHEAEGRHERFLVKHVQVIRGISHLSSDPSIRNPIAQIERFHVCTEIEFSRNTLPCLKTNKRYSEQIEWWYFLSENQNDLHSRYPNYPWKVKLNFFTAQDFRDIFHINTNSMSCDIGRGETYE